MDNDPPYILEELEFMEKHPRLKLVSGRDRLNAGAKDS